MEHDTAHPTLLQHQQYSIPRRHVGKLNASLSQLDSNGIGVSGVDETKPSPERSGWQQPEECDGEYHSGPPRHNEADPPFAAATLGQKQTSTTGEATEDIPTFGEGYTEQRGDKKNHSYTTLYDASRHCQERRQHALTLDESGSPQRKTAAAIRPSEPISYYRSATGYTSSISHYPTGGSGAPAAWGSLPLVNQVPPSFPSGGGVPQRLCQGTSSAAVYGPYGTCLTQTTPLSWNGDLQRPSAQIDVWPPPPPAASVPALTHYPLQASVDLSCAQRQAPTTLFGYTAPQGHFSASVPDEFWSGGGLQTHHLRPVQSYSDVPEHQQCFPLPLSYPVEGYSDALSGYTTADGYGSSYKNSCSRAVSNSTTTPWKADPRASSQGRSRLHTQVSPITSVPTKAAYTMFPYNNKSPSSLSTMAYPSFYPYRGPNTTPPYFRQQPPLCDSRASALPDAKGSVSRVTDGLPVTQERCGSLGSTRTSSEWGQPKKSSGKRSSTVGCCTW